MFHIMNDSFWNLKIRTLRLKEIGTCIPGSYGVPESHRLFTLYSNFSSFFRSPVGNDIGSSSPMSKIKLIGWIFYFKKGSCRHVSFTSVNPWTMNLPKRIIFNVDQKKCLFQILKIFLVMKSSWESLIFWISVGKVDT